MQFSQETVDTSQKTNTVFLLPPPKLTQGANFAHHIPTLSSSSSVPCALPPLHLASLGSNTDHTLPPIAFCDTIRENMSLTSTYYSVYHNEIDNKFSPDFPTQTSDFKISNANISKATASTSFMTDEERHRRRLELNRLAAKQSRERKKIYVANLESRAYRLAEENTTLKESIRQANERLISMNLEIEENHRLHFLIEDLKKRLL
ncbi:9560_t:CDS:1 [Ambispora leptoticha]|uniref:9560_t:CDS:1 n=1 Tax=Ambispora leptoticha TaxID=144679 RepID=A0A9N9AKH9_9GLOM|nr:9560_t:CDS:1 [Ambispora leptoticha]